MHGLDLYRDLRPRELETDVIRDMNGKEKWIGFFAIFNKNPSEVFIGSAENMGTFPNWVEKGNLFLRKEEGVFKYDFKFRDRKNQTITWENLPSYFDKSHAGYSMMVSLMLQSGLSNRNALDVVKHLDLGSADFDFWKDFTINIFQRYIPPLK